MHRTLDRKSVVVAQKGICKQASRRRESRILAVAAAATLAGLFSASKAGAQVNLLQNGDFSANAANYVVWPGYDGTGLPGNNPTAPTDWNISSGSGVNVSGTGITVFGPSNQSAVGAFAFVQNSAGSLSQGFTTTANHIYGLQFAAAQRNNGTTTADWQVQIDGTAVYTTTGLSNSQFAEYYAPTFTGDGSSHTLAFNATNYTGDAAADLSNVVLADISGVWQGGGGSTILGDAIGNFADGTLIFATAASYSNSILYFNDRDGAGNLIANSNLTTVAGGIAAGVSGPLTLQFNNNSVIYTITSNDSNGINDSTTGVTSIIKNGSGILTLNGTNAYSGGTTINAGGLAINNPNALGSGTANLGTASLYMNYVGAGTNFSNAISLTGNPTLFVGNDAASGAGSTPILTGPISIGIGDTGGTFTIESWGRQAGTNILTFSGANIQLGSKSLAIFGQVGGPNNVDSVADAYNQATILTNNGSTVTTLNTTGNVSVGRGALEVQGGSIVTIGGTLTNTSDWSNFEMQDLGTVVTVTGGINFSNFVATTLDLNGGTLYTPSIVGNHYSSAPAQVNFNGTRVVITGSTSDFLDVHNTGGGASANVAAGGAIFDTQAFNATINNSLAGVGAVTKYGSGTLTLTATNSYSGGNIINEGELALSGSGTLGQSGSPLSLNSSNAILDLGGSSNQVVGQVNTPGSGAIGTIQNGTLTANGSVNFQSGTISASLAGGGGLFKTGPGTLVLSGGSNAYTGGTTVSGGILQLQGSGTLGSTSGLLTVSGGTLDLNGSSVTVNGLSDGGSPSGFVTSTTGSPILSITTNNKTYSGTITGSVGLNITAGTGTQTLSGSNNYSGGTTVQSGTLTLVGNGGSVGSGGSGPVVINGGMLIVTGTDALGNNNYTSTNGITVNEGGTLSVGVGSTLTVDRNINSTGGTLAGASYILRNTAGNSYNFTSAADGTQSTLSAQSIGLQGNVTFAVTPGGFAGAIDLNVTGNLVDNSGKGSLIKTGAGVMTVSSANNSYGGSTTISGGTLRLAQSLTIVNGSFENFTGSLQNGNWGYTPTAPGWTFNYPSGIAANNTPWVSNTAVHDGAYAGYIQTSFDNGNPATGNPINGFITQSINVPQSGPYVITFEAANRPGYPSSSLVLSIGGASQTFVATGFANNGVFETYSATLQLTAGPQTLEFQGVNYYNTDSATAIDLVASAVASLPSSTDVNITSGSFDLNGNTQTIASLTGVAGTSVTLGNGTLTVSPASGVSTTYSGTISDGGGASTATGGSLVVTGSGTFTLAGANTYTGSTTVNSGTLNINGGSLGNTAVNVNGGTLNLQSAGAVSQNTVTVAGGSLAVTATNALTGSAALNVTSGTATISASNDYNGGTTVSGTGALVLASSNAGQANGAYTINANNGLQFGTGVTSAAVGSLAGTGTITLTNGDSNGVNLSVGGTSLSSNYGGTFTGAGGLTKTGTGTFTLNGIQTYGDTTTISGGVLKLSPYISGPNAFKITGDADSGISSSNTYTQAINPSGGGFSINGVPFTGAGTGSLAAGSLTPQGAIGNSIGVSNFGVNGINNNTNGWGNVSGNILNLYKNFNYGTQNRTVVLTGLAQNTWYDVRLYEKQWDNSVNRLFSVGYDVGDTGTPQYTSPILDQNEPQNTSTLNSLGIGQQNAWALTYVYYTGSQTSIALDVNSVDSGNTYHFYGLTNQVAAPDATNVLPDTGLTIASSGTLDLNSVSQTLPWIADPQSGGGGGLIMNSGILPTTLTLSPTTGGTSTFSGSIQDGASQVSLTMNGTGTQILAGANTYTGNTTVTAGTLSINGGSLGNTAVNVNGGTLNLQSAGAISLNTVTVAGGSLAVTATNALTGTAALNITSGTATISQPNDYSGGTIVSGTGALVLNSNDAGQANGVYTINTNNGLQFGAAVTTPAIGLLAGTANINLSNSNGVGVNLSMGGTGGNSFTSTYKGTFTGNGGLTKTGTGTLTLGVPQAYTGNTVISGGVLQLGTYIAGASYFKITSDLNSGISSSNTYTHAINPDGGGFSINGVPFTGAAPGTVSSLAAQGTIGNSIGSSNFGNNGWNAGTNGWSGATGNIVSLYSNFNYGSAPDRTVLLTGLTPGTYYDVRLYEKQFDTGAYRPFSVAYDVNGTGTAQYTSPIIDQNHPESTPALAALGIMQQNAWAMTYVYQAGSNGDISIDIGNQDLGNTYHFYGLTNQVATPTTNILPTTTTLTIASNSSLDLNGVSQTVAALSDPVSGTTTGATVTNSFAYPATLTLSPSGGSASFSGVIQDGASSTISLTMSGTGTQILTGTNTYSGPTTVNSGTLVLSGANTMTGAAIVNGGTLTLANPMALQNSTLTPSGGNVTFSGAAFTVGGLGGSGGMVLQNSAAPSTPFMLSVGNSNGPTTYAGVMSGPGSLTKIGTGILTLSAANTYGGTTTISNGTVQLFANTVAVGNPGFTAGTTSWTGSQYQTNPNSSEIPGLTWTFTGGGAVAANGGGGYGVSNSQTGFAGVIQGVTNMSQSLNFPAAGTYTLSFLTEYRNGLGPNQFNVELNSTVLNSSGIIPLSASSFNTVTETFSVAAAGPETLSFVGLDINGQNVAGGDLSSFVTNISIVPTYPGNLPNGTTLAVAPLAYFDLNGVNQTVGALSDTGPAAGGTVTNSNTAPATLTFAPSGGTPFTFTGTIQDGAVSGGMTVAVNGSGTQILAGNNTYTGGTNFIAGTLQVASAGALSTGPLTFTGGILQYGNGITTDYSSQLNTTVQNQQYKIDTNGNTVTWANSFGTTGSSLTKLGAGTLVLANTNTYTGGTVIAAGTLNFVNGALGTTGNISFSTLGGTTPGGTLQYSNLPGPANTQDISSRLMGSSAPIAIDTNGNNITYNSSIASSNIAGINKIGPGTLTLAAGQNYGGATVISGGVVKLTAYNTGASYFKITGDADSGISTANTYTHAINPNGGGFSVNGVPFTNAPAGALGTNSLASASYTQSGNPRTIGNSIGGSNFGNNPFGPSTNGWSGVTGSMLSLYSNFDYNTAPDRTVVLTGLTPGTYYDVRLYEKQFDTGAYRPFSVAYDVNGTGTSQYTSPIIDQNQPQNTPALAALGITQQNAWAMTYVYQAGSNGDISIDIGNQDLGNTYHFYGLTNQVATPNANVLPVGTPVSIAANATLDLSGVSQTIASLADVAPNIGGLVINSASTAPLTLTLSATGGSTSFSGTISDSGSANAVSLTMSGSGTQALSGLNTYSGPTTITGGILSTGSSGTLANGGSPSSIGQSSNAASNLFINGGTLQYAGAPSGSTDRLFTVGSAGATIDAASSMTFTNTNPIVFAATGFNPSLTLTNSVASVSTFWPSITDNAGGTTSLSKTGVGAWVIAGNNSYTGGTTVSGGTLLVGSPTALGNVATGAPVTVNGTGVLDLNGVNTAVFGLSDGNVDSNGVVTSNSGSATLTINGSSASYSGKIADGTTGQVSVVIAGGTQTFGSYSGAGPFSSYTGGTEVKANAMLVGVGIETTDGASAYAFGGNATSGGDVTVDANANVLSNVAGGTAFAPHANLTVNGTATFTNGTLDLSNNSINNTETIGQLNGSGMVVLYGNVYQSYPVPTNLLINDGGNFSGNINEGTGTYNNGLIPGNLANSAAGGSLTFTGNSVPSAPTPILGNLANVLTLSGQSTYTGGTTVTGGTLLVSGIPALQPPSTILSSATGLGPVTIQSTTANSASHPLAGNSRLGGNGTVGGDIIVASGGIISPGTTTNLSTIQSNDDSTHVATLGTYGNAVLNGGGTYVFKTTVNSGWSGTATVGNGYTDASSSSVWGVDPSAANQDFLYVAGTLDIESSLSNPFILDVIHPTTPPGNVSTNTFLIAGGAAGITQGGISNPALAAGTDLSQDFVVLDNGVQSSHDTVTVVQDGPGGTSYDLQVTVVTPEPGSLGLLGIASLGLLRRRRARKSASHMVGCTA